MEVTSKAVLLIFLLTGLLILASCSDKPPSLKPLDQTAAILAFGDSLTYGTGAAARQSYPSVLALLSGLKVINAGLPGELSGAGIQRLQKLLSKKNFSLVVLCHGGNDLLRRFDNDSIERNLSTMIALAHSHGSNVVLIGVPEPKLLFMQTAEIYDRLADRYNLVYLPKILSDLESDASMKSDSIHLNAKGYKKLAEAIDKALRMTGALPAH